MNFTSWEFIGLFLPCIVVLFYLLKSQTHRQYLLIASSLVFYAYSGFENCLVLVFSIIVNLLAGSILSQLDTSKKQPRLTVLWISIAINIACLLGFKWIALIDGNGVGFRIEEDILIPLALSFITFQQIGFVYGCYTKQIKQVNKLNYLFFIAFFPQLVMGPIVRYQDINRQLDSGKLGNVSWDNISIGVSIFVFGLAKKVLLADRLYSPIEQVFSTAEVSTFDMWFAIFAFQLQLFLDFSAYGDMAIGLAKIFNIDLPLNFDRPFKARDRFDLWRRWHISFAIFMRTHVFVPLVRKARIKAEIALVITALLSGLWHGLGITFVIWGGIQALIMLLTHYHKKWSGPSLSPSKLKIVGAIALTFLVNSLIGIVFRTPELEGLGTVYESLFVWNDTHTILTSRAWALFLLAAFVIWLLPDTHQIFYKYWTATDLRPLNNRPPGVAKKSWISFDSSIPWALVFSLLVLACVMSIDNSGRFIYVQF
ncbi:Peptidoglycan O-acetyltransferase [BD1-7 clade bacterium]|uniref:Probable alginate O-acetylase n=1 Tax=BD1-7 clade bacterium TaxID=2029982 RepID=A0A5S9PZ85_9GAMM|nr:Peptidoglycan O-acetyltransferase [BD1-7 clade bacterium]CAA0113090.1 Peptidoglycan O-acetyltransferase [BD1-7 clade bacterium]